MKKEEKRSKYLILLFSVICIVLIVWTLWGNTALEINEVVITSDRIPSAFSGLRIAQISTLPLPLQERLSG